MKRVLVVVVLIVAAAVLGLWRTRGGVRQGLSKAIGMSSDDSQDEVSDEIRKSFDLKPGARIEVSDINGSVDLQTSDSKTAEVYVLRAGNGREALNRREIAIEQFSDGLYVRSRPSRNMGFWEHLFGHRPKEQVTIKAPRQIVLAIKGVNGQVTSGDLEGSVELRGINGTVHLGQASDSAEIGGVNGNISFGMKQLNARGVRLSGVNGNIELRLSKGLNADLTARGMHGTVYSEISDVIVDKEEPGSRYSAHIGSGGAPIEIRGINGNVRLTRAENSTSGMASSDQKSVAPMGKDGKKAVETKGAKD